MCILGSCKSLPNNLHELISPSASTKHQDVLVFGVQVRQHIWGFATMLSMQIDYLLTYLIGGINKNLLFVRRKLVAKVLNYLSKKTKNKRNRQVTKRCHNSSANCYNCYTSKKFLVSFN